MPHKLVLVHDWYTHPTGRKLCTRCGCWWEDATPEARLREAICPLWPGGRQYGAEREAILLDWQAENERAAERKTGPKPCR